MRVIAARFWSGAFCYPIVKGPRMSDHHRYTYAESKLVRDYRESFGGVATCAICRRPISFDVPVNHPMSFNADHVTPLSRGGAHAVSNLRPVHHGCNASRGNRSDSDTAAPRRTKPPAPVTIEPVSVEHEAIRRSVCMCPRGKTDPTHECETVTHLCGYSCLHYSSLHKSHTHDDDDDNYY